MISGFNEEPFVIIDLYDLEVGDVFQLSEQGKCHTLFHIQETAQSKEAVCLSLGTGRYFIIKDQEKTVYQRPEMKADITVNVARREV